MSKTFKVVKLENQDFVLNKLKEFGFKTRVFPLRERGLNQSNFRKIEIVNPENNLLDKLKRSKKLQEFDIGRY